MTYVPLVYATAEGPQKGDVFVLADSPAAPLTIDDIKLGQKQIFAVPMDPVTKKVKDGSRLAKVLFVKFDEAALDARTKDVAAAGVLAFSAVCTHAGCDVSSWRAQEKKLLCFCHFTQFDPLDGGKVVAGPAPRALPVLPLTLEGKVLVAAGGFSAAPGVA